MKTLSGKIVSLKMNKTAIVEVTRYRQHPLYKKLLKISKRYKADKGDLELEIGYNVKIVETKPISKDKNFKIMEVIK